jgi:hypothetical protein
VAARDQPVARADLAAAHPARVAAPAVARAGLAAVAHPAAVVHLAAVRADLAAARPPLEDVTNGNHPRCC